MLPPEVATGLTNRSAVYTLVSVPAESVGKADRLVATEAGVIGWAALAGALCLLIGFVGGYLLRGSDNRRSAQ